MKRLNLFKYGLTALMMAFAMTLCYSCSSDDDEQNNNQEVNPPSNGESEISGTINGHDYVVLAGYKWATENVDKVNGAEAEVTDTTYGCYYRQDYAKKAAASWGVTWHLPTKYRWLALIQKCNWTWKSSYSYKGKNVPGMLVVGKKENGEEGNSIFLPAAGYYYAGNSNVLGQGGSGFYWSADDGRYLFFNGGDRRMFDNGPRNGMAVRPVAN